MGQGPAWELVCGVGRPLVTLPVLSEAGLGLVHPSPLGQGDDDNVTQPLPGSWDSHPQTTQARVVPASMVLPSPCVYGTAGPP